MLFVLNITENVLATGINREHLTYAFSHATVEKHEGIGLLYLRVLHAGFGHIVDIHSALERAGERESPRIRRVFQRKVAGHAWET